MTMDEKLRPTERLHSAFEFEKVFEEGRCFRTPWLRVHYRPNPDGRSRLGLVVSRRVGKAVLRNRVKRILREVFRRNKGRLPAPLDVVLVPQREARTHAEYLEAFLRFAESGRAGREGGGK
jgi:ribonuclease P protein component